MSRVKLRMNWLEMCRNPLLLSPSGAFHGPLPLRRRSRAAVYLGCLALAANLSLLACQPLSSVPSFPAAGRRHGESTFVLFLNGPSKTPLAITLELAAVEAVRADGTRHPILARPFLISSLGIVDRQLLLAETGLPWGVYRELHLRISRARVRRGDQEIDLAVPPEGFSFNVDFEMKPDEATPLFMSWDVERSIEREAFLRPAFAFRGRARELRRVIAYVTNEESDTVSVIDRSADRVIDVIEVGSRPKGVAVSPDSSRAFVVNSASNTLTILDVGNNKVLHTANLDVAARPSDIAIHPDGRTLYVANTALNSVSVIDASSFQTVQVVPVGQRPVALAVDPRGTRLLVANMGSHTVSAIDTRRNLVTTTIPVEFQPTWVAMDPAGTRAFVTHLRSPRIAIISLATLRVERKVSLGSANALLPDDATGRAFVAVVPQNRLSFFDLNVDGELDSVKVGEDPYRLALDVDRAKVYVVNRGSNSVTVVDRNTRRVRTEVPMGKDPYGIAIVR